MSLSTSWHDSFPAWLRDALNNPKYCEQTFLRHEPADEGSLKIAASSIFTIALQDSNQCRAAQMCCTLRRWRDFREVTFLRALVEVIQAYYDANVGSKVFKEEAHNLVELEKFATFVAWLYNVRAMRPKIFSSIAAELLLARPAADLKAYLGGLMIQKVGHVLILDGINVHGKILTRIDELAKQPTTRLMPETKALLAAVVGQHLGWSKQGNQKYADLQKALEKAKKDLEEVKELRGAIEAAREMKHELLERLGRSSLGELVGFLIIPFRDMAGVLKNGYKANGVKFVPISSAVREGLAGYSKHNPQEKDVVALEIRDQDSQMIKKLGQLKLGSGFEHWARSLEPRNLSTGAGCFTEEAVSQLTCPFCSRSLRGHEASIGLNRYKHSPSCGSWMPVLTPCPWAPCWHQLQDRSRRLSDNRILPSLYFACDAPVAKLFRQTSGKSFGDRMGVYPTGVRLETTPEAALAKVNFGAGMEMLKLEVAMGSEYSGKDEDLTFEKLWKSSDGPLDSAWIDVLREGGEASGAGSGCHTSTCIVYCWDQFRSIEQVPHAEVSAILEKAAAEKAAAQKTGGPPHRPPGDWRSVLEV